MIDNDFEWAANNRAVILEDGQALRRQVGAEELNQIPGRKGAPTVSRNLTIPDRMTSMSEPQAEGGAVATPAEPSI